MKKLNASFFWSISIALTMSLTACGPSVENQFSEAIKTGDYVTAESIYDQNASDSEFNLYATEECHAVAMAMIKEYSAGEIDSDSILTSLNHLSPFIDVSTLKKDVEEIQTSKEYFKKGKNMMEDGSYREAYHLLKKTQEIDSQNYESAQILISECIAQYNQSLSVDLKNLGNASTPVDEVLSYEYDTTLAEDRLKTEYTQLRKHTINQLLDQATEQVNNGHYQNAAEILKPYTSFDATIKSKYTEYSQQADTERFQTLKKSISVAYDDIDKEYKIVPKGYSTRYSNIGWSTYIAPELVVSKKESDFYLQLGFFASDWLFTDRIIIDCDGTQFKFDVAYSHLVTEVIGSGNIAEVYPLLHQTSSYGFDDRVQNLAPLMDAISAAETVKIRFEGSYGKGHKDVTINAKQISTLTTLWEVNSILNRTPKLRSEL